RPRVDDAAGRSENPGPLCADQGPPGEPDSRPGGRVHRPAGPSLHRQAIPRAGTRRAPRHLQDPARLGDWPDDLIASQIRHGVSGISRLWIPRGRSASITALATAGVAPVVPPSPIPLTPIGLCGVAVSVRSVSKLGRSAAGGGREVIRSPVSSGPSWT